MADPTQSQQQPATQPSSQSTQQQFTQQSTPTSQDTQQQATQHQPTSQSSQQPDIRHTEVIDYKFQKYHNICAYIDPEVGEMNRYAELMRFLMRSRISKAISENVPVFKSHQDQFWSTSGVNDLKNPTEIRGKVCGKRVVITEGLIREILQFGDNPSDPTELNTTKVRGCLIRCGYPAQRGVVEGTVYKKLFCPVYKYLAHVIIHCLGPRKSGFDQMSQTLQNSFAALVLNMPFNFSKMVFDYLVELVVGKKDIFLMYPRFLQILFNSQIPDLTGQEGDILVFAHMDIKTVRSMKDYSSKQARPKEVKLVGHLTNIDYVCPPGDKWRNEGSDAEKEEVVVTQVGQSSGAKRKSDGMDDEEEIEEVEIPLRRRKRPNLALAPRATAFSATEPIPTPDPASAATTSTTTATASTPQFQVAGSSSTSTKLEEQMTNMQQLVIAMMNKMNKQEEKIEKLEREKVEMIEMVEQVKKEKEETVELVKQMKLENAETSNLLLLEMGRSKKMEERVAEVEKQYDSLQNMLVKDSEGYFRDKDYVGSESDDEEAPRITSTSAGTDK